MLTIGTWKKIGADKHEVVVEMKLVALAARSLQGSVLIILKVNTFRKLKNTEFK